MARRRGLSEDDLKLWAAYGRTLSRLLPGRVVLPLAPDPPQPDPPAPVAPPVAVKPSLARPPAELGINTAPAGLDKSSWKHFHTGKIRVEARLDLHGHTAVRAHHKVQSFLEQAHGTGMRCVEIITGKGEILARELPHWLNAPALRPYILALAHPHAANTGSVRILLRRRRA
ncbi:MAG TPA: Smr/MutS family protein [Acidocella sp.]|jgi:DNA-nicking Smr family endonuclease|nr:Smr/MutS family protein [Acidocella sp.]